jgi:hypothetical protein
LFFELIKPILKVTPTPMPSPPPEAVAGVGIFLIVVWLIGILMYFIPAIAGMRHKQAAAIFILNFFLGWTIIGWVGALVWACTKTDRS